MTGSSPCPASTSLFAKLLVALGVAAQRRELGGDQDLVQPLCFCLRLAELLDKRGVRRLEVGLRSDEVLDKNRGEKTDHHKTDDTGDSPGLEDDETGDSHGFLVRFAHPLHACALLQIAIVPVISRIPP